MGKSCKSDDAKKVYPRPVTARVLEQFTNLTAKSIQQHISDLITVRLKTALRKEDEKIKKQEALHAEKSKSEEKNVVTIQNELEGFLFANPILRRRIDANRIFYRDAQSYFAILLDDNNRKAICPLYLNGSRQFLATLDENKKEVKNEISSLDDIFNYSDLLVRIIDRFEKA